MNGTVCTVLYVYCVFIFAVMFTALYVCFVCVLCLYVYSEVHGIVHTVLYVQCVFMFTVKFTALYILFCMCTVSFCLQLSDWHCTYRFVCVLCLYVYREVHSTVHTVLYVYCIFLFTVKRLALYIPFCLCTVSLCLP